MSTAAVTCEPVHPASPPSSVGEGSNNCVAKAAKGSEWAGMMRSNLLMVLSIVQLLETASLIVMFVYSVSSRTCRLMGYGPSPLYVPLSFGTNFKSHNEHTASIALSAFALFSAIVWFAVFVLAQYMQDPKQSIFRNTYFSFKYDRRGVAFMLPLLILQDCVGIAAGATLAGSTVFSHAYDGWALYCEFTSKGRNLFPSVMVIMTCCLAVIIRAVYMFKAEPDQEAAKPAPNAKFSELEGSTSCDSVELVV